VRRQLKQLALETVYHLRMHRFISRFYSGVGTIFIMHRIARNKTASLATELTITENFLDRVIRKLKESADFVTLDNIFQLLVNDQLRGKRDRPVIALTFDDGFRDNLMLALPILRDHGVPATIYVPSGAPDRLLDPWPWRLEKSLWEHSDISLDWPGLPPRLPTRTWPEKRAAFRFLTLFIHENIPVNRNLTEILLPTSRVSDEALMDEQFVNWDELRQLAADPLITIGGHAVTHASLRDLEKDQAFREIDDGRKRLIAQLDVPVRHFAYPYGESSNFSSREFALVARAGYHTAVTNISGNIFHQHQQHLMCLPRIALGGVTEKVSSAVLELSGASTALSSRWNNPVVTG